MLRFMIHVSVVLVFATLGGCNAYMIQGKVVRGTSPGIELVYQADERLGQQGIAGTEIRITRDPTKPNRHLVGQARSNPSGDFTVVMDEFGTGWMQEAWLVQGTANGFGNTEQLLELPSNPGKWRLLITLAPGMAVPLSEDEIMRDLERFR